MLDWSKIKVLMGFADHVPDAIIRLYSEYEDVRKRAYKDLDNTIIVQGGLFEASYHVIEPIIELLEKPYTVDRYWPLTLLADIAYGANNDDLMDDGRTIGQACQDKFRLLKDRIEKIETRTKREQVEKEAILEKTTM